MFEPSLDLFLTPHGGEREGGRHRRNGGNEGDMAGRWYVNTTSFSLSLFVSPPQHFRHRRGRKGTILTRGKVFFAFPSAFFYLLSLSFFLFLLLSLFLSLPPFFFRGSFSLSHPLVFLSLLLFLPRHLRPTPLSTPQTPRAGEPSRAHC